MKAVSPGWFGPRVRPLSHVILPGWTNSSGQEEEERGGEDWGDRSGDWWTLLRGRLGGPDARGTEGSLFLFCFVPSEWGQLLLSGGLSTVRLYRIPPISQLPPSSPTKRPSLNHTHPSIHLQCQISWGHAVFCRCPGERADVQPEEERPFIVSVARQNRFLLPLRRSL